MELSDGFGRTFKYLRLSITDVCNFRCSYCLPDGYKPCGKPSFLSLDELRRAAIAFAGLGVSKIRLTGGEPTVRKDFDAVAAAISNVSQVKKLALTTNGYRLPERVKAWHDAGITAINVSLDSLSRDNFRKITGHDRRDEVLRGIEAALEAGIETVKVNAVYMKGINDEEIDAYLKLARKAPISVRFIELMETRDHTRFFKKHHLSTDILKDRLVKEGWIQKNSPVDAGPAKIFIHPDYKGDFGLIAPYSKDFCKSCNRLRFSSTGDLHLCLFGKFGIPMRAYLQCDTQIPEFQKRLQAAVKRKLPSHFLAGGETGMTPNLSRIGG